MTIRTATEDDTDAISRIAEQAWKRDYPDILSRDTAEESVNDWYAPKRIAEELGRSWTELLVAERDEAVVAFAHADVDDQSAYILRLYVHPEHRREGVGRELLEQTCDALSKRGVDRIYAVVLAENEPGNAFYDRFGFEREDERETTIGGESYPENKYVLERPFDLAGT
ncbi:N-acetyltransferase family protein [Halobacteriales archaeon Cl-PHB]